MVGRSRSLFAGFVLALAALAAVEHSLPGEEPAVKNPKVEVGQVAPEIGGHLCTGDALVPQYDGEKYLLAVYWSLDDPQAAAWETKLREIRKTFLKNENLLMLSICVDGDWDKWMKYLDDAAPLDENGGKHNFYSDRRWFQANIYTEESQWHPPRQLVDKDKLPVAYLISKWGKFWQCEFRWPI